MASQIIGLKGILWELSSLSEKDAYKGLKSHDWSVIMYEITGSGCNPTVSNWIVNQEVQKEMQANSDKVVCK